MTIDSPKRRDPNVWPLVAAALGVTVIFATGIAAGLGMMPRLISAAPAVWLIGAAIFMIGGFVVGARWMTSVDELAQRAHYEGWYWGGSIGVAAMGFLVLAAPVLSRFVDIETLLDPFRQFAGSATGFVAGVFVSMVALIVGYLGWWGYFWLKKR